MVALLHSGDCKDCAGKLAMWEETAQKILDDGFPEHILTTLVRAAASATQHSAPAQRAQTHTHMCTPPTPSTDTRAATHNSRHAHTHIHTNVVPMALQPDRGEQDARSMRCPGPGWSNHLQ